MSQKRFVNTTWFALDDLASLLNAAESLMISAAMKMNSQHDWMKKYENCMKNNDTAVDPAAWDRNAIKYPDGGFQSNGYLYEIKVWILWT